MAARAAATLLSSPDDLALKQTLHTAQAVDTVDSLADQLDKALVERPPALPKEGAVFRTGYDAELDEIASLCKSGAHHTVELESRLKAELDIPTLKVRYTRVFGWYVEVGRSHVARVPKSFRRKQTVASGERYTLPELDELAERIESADERHRERELALLRQLMDQVVEHGSRLATLAALVSRWDCAAALAEVAHRHDYVRPDVDDSDVLNVSDGRHPVVERWAAAGRFVPNDVHLQADRERLWIVTGPNMAGKSTLLRQTALIAILAQMGSYVPARGARIGVVDQVLSRVGASDNLARGESTFMVEMRETADILLSATSRSLVILDEIGRGTSTFDGLAIAWAVAEHLADVVKCRALFATHYHEMTTLADDTPHVENYSVSARELDGDIVFLHRLVHGPASQSYGVAVAKLAGLPVSVLERAAELLQSLERGGSDPSERGCRTPSPRLSAPAQLSLFRPAQLTPSEQRVLERLEDQDFNRLSPMDALALLATLQAELRKR
jgi:DNA mismatch repair protein MutS